MNTDYADLIEAAGIDAAAFFFFKRTVSSTTIRTTTMTDPTTMPMMAPVESLLPAPGKEPGAHCAIGTEFNGQAGKLLTIGWSSGTATETAESLDSC